MRCKLQSFLVIGILLLSHAEHAFSQNAVGSWKFDDPMNLLAAEIGKSLELVGSHLAVAGPEEHNGAARIGIGSYYKMTHGIPPNGGGSFVNEYTVQIDFKVADIQIWHTFFQTSKANSNDGECFINPTGNIGVAATGYSSYSVKPNEWCRLVISVKNPSYYNYFLSIAKKRFCLAKGL